ncbi:AraC family transcriptional regulator [Flavobacterium sp. ZE23DGlu08]|uniref:AraC family transcriptional regulator n=1 Tax=Flavobacterium sp. ZE23DGlu08 TaxID=3059026 RepID=UPI00265DEFBF|nr:AraC family transcriptional regulator [Flavobacterium sp. ZE23DGlu08]WKL42732.1 AraC family transcriptional regulator [Flavobacterium sp. ZE23DGlu08]
MPKLNQFETLVIDEFEEDKFHLPTHSHTYYEIIYIVKGNGIHHLNNNLLSYKTGDLFVISPDDEHYFDIKKSTRFVFIKFTDNYFNSNKKLSCDEFLLNTPENFMRDKSLKENVLKLDEPCKTILKNTIENITAYNSKTNVSTSPIIFYQVLSIFGLIKETMRCMNMQITGTGIDNEQIISYIHQNIYNPKLVQIKSISTHFNIATTYFGTYFKRSFSITYRDYTNNLRTKLIEKRFFNNQVPIKQIAYEFGFTDESHLSNYFKKQKNMKPSDFKKL